MKKKQDDRVIVRLIKETKPIAKWLLLAAVLNIISVLTAVSAPKILGDIIQRLIDIWSLGEFRNIHNNILISCASLLLIYAIYAASSYLNMLLMNRVVSRHYSCGLRIKLSDKIRRLPIQYVDQTPVGDIIRKMTDDVSEMGGYVHEIIDTAIKGGLQIVLIFFAMMFEDWRLALFVILLTPLSLILSSKIAGMSEKHYDNMFERSGKLTELVEESFTNFATTKAYNRQSYTEARHDEINEQVRKANIKANFIGSTVQPLIRLFNSLAYILINLIGGYFAIKNGGSVGAVVTIVLYARLFASPLEQIAYGFSQLNRVKAASRRVFAILDMEEEMVPEGELRELAGKIDFENVSFRYVPEEPLIESLNISVKPGQNIAIVGPTGAGKTTIVNLLMRFYDPDSGRVLLDGVDTQSCSRESVRDNIGMVLQDTWLFKGTIAENVAYGKPGASMEEIRAACEKAHCDHFIQTMPMGYDTEIGDDDSKLSGGQKQLLTIARAILADKPLLILDEATSNVDTRTEILIQSAMDRLMMGKTSFVIAHRLSTIVGADLILVLDHGRIVEQGTHQQLLNKNGFYHRLYTSQYAF